jgi:hypothetical protein
MKWTFIPAALACLLFAAGCGSKAEVPTRSCVSDAVCDDDQLCHPLTQVCVKRCNNGGECPTSAKNCAAFTEGGPTFCQCQTTPLCGDEEVAVCATEDRICTFRCVNDVDCTKGRACDRDAGQCLTR